MKLTPLRDGRLELSKRVSQSLAQISKLKPPDVTFKAYLEQGAQHILFICWGRGWGAAGRGDGVGVGGGGHGAPF